MPLLMANLLSVLLVTIGRLAIGDMVDSDTTGALAAEAECGSGAEDCALNALQLRGEMLVNHAEQTVSGVSGLGESGADQSHWPRCAKYGCFARYSRHSVCQCNPHCHHYRNCCPDYNAKCNHHVPSPPPPPAVHYSHRPSPPPAAQPAAGSGSAMCSAVPSCAKLNLGGACCPTPAGNYLGCCPESMVPHATAPPPVIMSNRKVMTVYHQTSPEACHSILKTGFRLGHGGWCGDAIYFALSPEATKTKAITPHSGIGCMLEAQVDLGNTQKFPCCRYCGGSQNEHVSWTEDSLKAKGYDSIEINPGDGPEIIVYNNNRIISMREIPFKTEWTPNRMHYKE